MSVAGGAMLDIREAVAGDRYVEEEALAGQLGGALARLARSPVRDRFARAVKSLVVVAGGGSAGFDRRVGLSLELVPLADPAALRGVGVLPVRLLHQGRPLAGVRVSALSRLDPLRPVHEWTDAAGEARLQLPHGGEWLVKAVRVRPAAAQSGADLDSLWTSLTFRTDLPGESP